MDIPFDQYNFLMARVGNIQQAMAKDELLLGQRKRKREVVYFCWQTPRPGWVKLNQKGLLEVTREVQVVEVL